jgi:hypothetical protein
MPRDDIFVHLTCALAGERTKEVAVAFQHQVLAKAGVADEVLQLGSGARSRWGPPPPYRRRCASR